MQKSLNPAKNNNCLQLHTSGVLKKITFNYHNKLTVFSLDQPDLSNNRQLLFFKQDLGFFAFHTPIFSLKY